MRRPVQTLLLALTGTGLLHVALFTDLYLRYVKAGLRPPLIVSGVVLLLLALAAATRGGPRPAPHIGPGTPSGHGHEQPCGDDSDHAHEHERLGEADQPHGHDHTGTPRIAWLLFLPALSLLVHAPPALGAYTAARANTKPVAVHKGFAALPVASPVPLTLTGFTERVQQDRSRAVAGRAVRLTGFVTPAGGRRLVPDPHHLLLLRGGLADGQGADVRQAGAARRHLAGGDRHLAPAGHPGHQDRGGRARLQGRQARRPAGERLHRRPSADPVLAGHSRLSRSQPASAGHGPSQGLSFRSGPGPPAAAPRTSVPGLAGRSGTGRNARPGSLTGPAADDRRREVQDGVVTLAPGPGP